jgi:hypothetical protein
MAARLEAVDPPEGLKKNVLDDVGGLGGSADPPRQPSVRPAHQRRQLAAEQQLNSGLSPVSRPTPKVQR